MNIVYLGLLGTVGAVVWLAVWVGSGFNMLILSAGLLAVLYLTGRK